MSKYGESKRLELWWQLYRTSLPVRDFENFRPMDFCRTECTCTFVFGRYKSSGILSHFVVISSPRFEKTKRLHLPSQVVCYACFVLHIKPQATVVSLIVCRFIYRKVPLNSNCMEVFVLLGCDAASLGDRCPRFRDNIVVFCNRIDMFKKNYTFLPWKTRRHGRLETSDINHPATRRYIPEKRRPHLHGCKNVTCENVCLFTWLIP